ncbi:MAG: hypothetical protein FWG75_06365 [Cystobacterineae bacterium]|nr:hypothetical protein [Cystobacterineae bacterium]
MLSATGPHLKVPMPTPTAFASSFFSKGKRLCVCLEFAPPGRYVEYMRFFIPPCTLLWVVWGAALLGACQHYTCEAALCQGCCSPEGICLEGTEVLACGAGGEACMRCSGGQSCSLGICLGGNPNSNPGSSGGGQGNGEAAEASALWWVEDSSARQSTLTRYLPKLQKQTQFPFASPVLLFEASPNGERWAVVLATSPTQYALLHATGDKTSTLQTGSGIPQKVAFAENSQGLAFLLNNGHGQGLLFYSAHATEGLRRISFSSCGLADTELNVLAFALSPNGLHVAVLAFVGSADPRAGVWLLGTAQPGTCMAVVHPEEAMGMGPAWGAFGPLQWSGNSTFYFRAALLQDQPQLYSSNLDGMRNPIAIPNSINIPLLNFAINPSLSLLAFLQEGTLSFLSLRPPFTLRSTTGCNLGAHPQNNTLLFSPNNAWLLLREGARSQMLYLGNMEGGNMECSLTPTAHVMEAVWSPSGNFLAELSSAGLPCQSPPCENSASHVVSLSQSEGKTMSNPNIISIGSQRLHQLKWTRYEGAP